MYSQRVLICVSFILALISGSARATDPFPADTFYVTAQGGGIYTVSGSGTFQGLFAPTSGGHSPNVAFFGGELFYVDADNGIVWKYAMDATRTAYASGFVTGFFTGPSGLLFDTAGYMYVTEIGTGNIWLVPPGGGNKDSGDFMLLAQDGAFIEPSAIAWGPDCSIYVGQLGSTLLALRQDGTIDEIATGLNRSSGLQLEPDGTVYVSEHYSHKVTKILPDGTKSLLFNMTYPEGHTYDDSGRRFVMESTGRRLVEFDAAGTKTTFATLPGTPASVDQVVWYGGGDGPYPAPLDPVCSFGTETDSDGDGVPDDEDICPGWDDLLDIDDDGIPDGCDDCPLDLNNDSDGDGSCDSVDMCLGNDTTGDSDSDGLCNDIDPCVGISNSDIDGDGICDEGDLCFGDDATGNADGDGICDDLDVCEGDDASGDTDSDQFCDDLDVCPQDVENDGDFDGICESEDNCPLTANDNQSDLDGDDVGDACDDDIDGDGVLNNNDNCIYDVNPAQMDFDNDSEGDVCDDDIDGDGIVDAADACVPTPVGEAVDTDGCSIGELCPCENNWKNHGAYVRCVAHTSEDFIDAGLINEAEKDATVSAAGESQCGHKK